MTLGEMTVEELIVAAKSELRSLDKFIESNVATDNAILGRASCTVGLACLLVAEDKLSKEAAV